MSATLRPERDKIRELLDLKLANTLLMAGVTPYSEADGYASALIWETLRRDEDRDLLGIELSMPICAAVDLVLDVVTALEKGGDYADPDDIRKALAKARNQMDAWRAEIRQHGKLPGKREEVGCK